MKTQLFFIQNIVVIAFISPNCVKLSLILR